MKVVAGIFWRSLTVALTSAALIFLVGCDDSKPTTKVGDEIPTGVKDKYATIEDALREMESEIPSNANKNAYFGELHMHTAYSLDAYIGGARLSPSDAYRFAKGESMKVNGQLHNLVKPLDFAAVTDHSEFLGEMYSTLVEGSPGHGQPELVELRSLDNFEDQEAWFLKYVVSNNRSGSPQHTPFYPGDDVFKMGWQVIIDAAIEHYEPGKFTTLPAFEWSAAPKGGNMHRNIIFRDLKLPHMPISSIDTSDEEVVWGWLEKQEQQGSTLLAIPHNSNASKGLMFEPVDNKGKPLTAEYAKRRAKWEPLIEMMQIKGNSEVNRKLWPADEFADFENADSMTNYSGRSFEKENFVRWAVTKGLDFQAKLGSNPYKLGFVGGTDSHNGTPSDVVEDNYIGSHGAADNSVERRREGDIGGWIMAKDTSPGAMTGVWAPKNTRGAIYDALRARETFATSGTRIQPRFFAGEHLQQRNNSVSLVENGYKHGVPMGGTLQKSKRAPGFNVYASKDPDGANLDRIQIIKGWVNEQGEPQERIVNVVWSDNRELNEDGSLPKVGNTVDIARAEYSNSIGSSELIGYWKDDNFDPQQYALYYMRVLEIPTPRWSTYDAVKNNLPVLEDVPKTVQERAWTSPIWYAPQ